MKVSAEIPFWSQQNGGVSAPAAMDSFAPSFAQLLEAGSNAGTVSYNRALGFSEAGIMGLHFAFGASPAPLDQADCAPDTSPTEAAIAATVDRPATSLSVPAPKAPSGSAAAPAPGPIDHRANGGNTSKSALEFPSLETDAAPFLPEADEGCESAARPASRHARATQENGKTPRLQLKLVSSGDEIAVVADGFGHDDETRRELEKSTRDVATEFGVTVSKLIVSSTSSAVK